ncbi:MAG TPA: cytochrome bc complex cytochrome b subunit, partial [Actinomycetota bacterium]|nr:cytochrome bc complex cytochrome b subunit [Actinomycetota bacterium]
MSEPASGPPPLVQDRIGSWLDERLHLSRFARQALNKVFPDHWSFMFGEIALYSFVVLVLTGVFLTFFYQASSTPVTYEGSYAALRGVEVSTAYESTLRLSFDVRAGLVMRQTHHWAALVFLGAIVVHLCRVFFTGAFRKPREINWLIGVTLLLLALFNGFAGYSLPDDLLSGTGLRIMYSITLSVPLVGPWAAFLLFGGEFPSDQILGRLFALHIFVVPAILATLLAVHLALIWHQKHTQFP